jgi:aminoglycoside phosphotransferase (APT) family kinase protein
VQRRMGYSMIDALLRLGEVDPLSVGLGDFGKPRGFLERQVARWRGQLEHYQVHAGWAGPSSLPGVIEVAQWLEANRPKPSRTGILHGDFHLANVMFRPESAELAAVIDWELATVGDPLLDLGWLVATWPDADGQGAGTIRVSPWQGFPSTAELLVYYRERSPRDLSAIDWYVVLARFKLGILLEGSYARSCAGKAPAELGARHHASALRLLSEAKDLIGQLV